MTQLEGVRLKTFKIRSNMDHPRDLTSRFLPDSPVFAAVVLRLDSSKARRTNVLLFYLLYFRAIIKAYNLLRILKIFFALSIPLGIPFCRLLCYDFYEKAFIFIPLVHNFAFVVTFSGMLCILQTLFVANQQLAKG